MPSKASLDDKARLSIMTTAKLALAPIWGFAVLFSALLYVKYKRLKRIHVKPLS